MTSRVLGCVAAVGLAAGAADAEMVFALSTHNQIVRFDSANPGVLLDAHFIGGFQEIGEELIGIDFRPATGVLFGLSSANRLYTVNLSTAHIGTLGNTFPQLNGVEYGFDFNPVADRIRVTSDLGSNFRLDPNTGLLTATDVNLQYAAGDPNAGVTPNVVGSAYSNNVGGAATTTLYDIDSGLDALVIQNPPNNGTLNTVGSLGFNTSGLVGFDISGASGTAFASLTAPGGAGSSLYTINLTTGAATLVGGIGGNATPLLIRDISVQPVPGPGGAGVLAGAGVLLMRRRRR